MKSPASWFVVFATLILSASVHGSDFHVAPDGSDDGPGTSARPFRSLERARDAARLAPPATVRLASGTYRLRRTLELDARDSGTRYLGTQARISGGIEVPAHQVKPVDDPAVRARLLPEVRDQIRVVDLRALGIDDPGAIGPRGFGRPYLAAPAELYVDDQPLILARWPKAGQPGEPIGTVIDPGAARPVGAIKPHGGTFAFASDRPLRWRDAEDVWITGFFMHGYADDTLQVQAFDLEKRTITTVQAHGYGFGSGQPWNRWTALNLLEELSLPGECMIDRTHGKIYFLPPTGTDPARSRFEVAALRDPLIAIEGATGVVFDGVDIGCGRGIGVYIERGSANEIRRATLKNLGLVAVAIGQGAPAGGPAKASPRELGDLNGHLFGHPTWNRQAGSGHRVVDCAIFNTGSGAVSLGGGDRAKLVPAGNVVENCDLHHFNRWDRTYRAAINIDGVGNAIRHCLIHDCPGSAILLRGNDHVIEYNEIHHAMMEGDDMGAFYMGRDPTERGNIIRWNHWHDLAPANRTHCLYLDDSGGDGTLIQGNYFRKAGRVDVIFVNGGSDIRIEDNVFIDCPSVVNLNGTAGNNHNKFYTPGGLFESRLKAVAWQDPPWRDRYPEFLDYRASFATLPRGRLVTRNLVVNSPLSFRAYPPGNYMAEKNWTTKEDPGFVDARNGDYTLVPGSPAFTAISGFSPGEFRRIGLRRPVPGAP